MKKFALKKDSGSALTEISKTGRGSGDVCGT